MQEFADEVGEVLQAPSAGMALGEGLCVQGPGRGFRILGLRVEGIRVEGLRGLGFRIYKMCFLRFGLRLKECCQLDHVRMCWLPETKELRQWRNTNFEKCPYCKSESRKPYSCSAPGPCPGSGLRAAFKHALYPSPPTPQLTKERPQPHLRPDGGI